MKVCFPVESDEGLESTVFGHFGSAGAFVVVDTEDGGHKVLMNNDAHHAHGMCSPLKALGGESVDSIVVGGIGAGALGKLAAMGIEVFRANEGTVNENLAHLQKSELVRFSPALTCGGHGHGGGCSH
ncbi:MAG: NifB/NifX family molybdenum-iron cluster-binding protein [Thermodesulfovibrionales bacterium]|nr:NifB/NifX family molybdenum-iron cluster-binding protein [Thermodesulfovibrionales bacterium]